MKHKILITTALIFFSACMKVKKKDDETPPVAAQLEQAQQVEQMPLINTRTELDYKYEVSETTDYHKVHFFAPKAWGHQVIVKIQKGAEQNQGVVNFNEQGEWVDALIPGEKVTYKFYTKFDTELKLLDEAEVLPVLDLNVEAEDIDLMQLYKITAKTKVIHIRNLEVQSQKHLYMEDFSGTIVVDHLKTDNGFIQTFPFGNRTADDQEGRSGGQVILVIKDGQGQLVVMMKGQNGGNGSPATEPDASMNGAPAARTIGSEFIETFLPAVLSSNPYVLNLSFGSVTYQCKTPPGKPSNGNKGMPGRPGQSGHNGGNSGSIHITNLSPNLIIDFQSQPGIGGHVSKGGNGGEGSEPGEIADGNKEDLFIWIAKNSPLTFKFFTKEVLAASITVPCTASARGSKGDKGDPGPGGANNGEDGIKQPSFINSIKQP